MASTPPSDATREAIVNHHESHRQGRPTPAAAASCRRLRIVVIGAQPDIWCDTCALPVAVTLTYLVEMAGAPPSGLDHLTYCDSCDGDR
jgi:hypothetical protein